MRDGTVALRGIQILSEGCDGKRRPDIDLYRASRKATSA
jgi:hypothetical protein